MIIHKEMSATINNIATTTISPTIIVAVTTGSVVVIDAVVTNVTVSVLFAVQSTPPLFVTMRMKKSSHFYGHDHHRLLLSSKAGLHEPEILMQLLP